MEGLRREDEAEEPSTTAEMTGCLLREALEASRETSILGIGSERVLTAEAILERDPEKENPDLACPATERGNLSLLVPRSLPVRADLAKIRRKSRHTTPNISSI